MQMYSDDGQRNLAFEQARVDRQARVVAADTTKYALGSRVHTVAILRNGIGQIERRDVVGIVESTCPNVFPTVYVVALSSGERVIRCAADLGMVKL